MEFSAPVPLLPSHDLGAFDCGEPALNDWLKQRALKNESRFSRTYVVCEGDRVVAYYCISAGAVERADQLRGQTLCVITTANEKRVFGFVDHYFWLARRVADDLAHLRRKIDRSRMLQGVALIARRLRILSVQPRSERQP